MGFFDFLTKKKEVEFLRTFTIKYSLDIFRDESFIVGTPEMEARVQAESVEEASKKLKEAIKTRYRVVPIIKTGKESTRA